MTVPPATTTVTAGLSVATGNTPDPASTCTGMVADSAPATVVALCDDMCRCHDEAAQRRHGCCSASLKLCTPPNSAVEAMVVTATNDGDYSCQHAMDSRRQWFADVAMHLTPGDEAVKQCRDGRIAGTSPLAAEQLAPDAQDRPDSVSSSSSSSSQDSTEATMTASASRWRHINQREHQRRIRRRSHRQLYSPQSSTRSSSPPPSSPSSTSSSTSSSPPSPTRLSRRFSRLGRVQQTSFIHSLVDVCSREQLALLVNSILPRLKVDILGRLPHEISVHILHYLPIREVGRVARVSRAHAAIATDNQLWRLLCERYRFVEPAEAVNHTLAEQPDDTAVATGNVHTIRQRSMSLGAMAAAATRAHARQHRRNSEPLSRMNINFAAGQPSYRQLFRSRYVVRSNWAHGRCSRTAFDGPSLAIITSLQFDERLLVIGTDSTAYGYIEVRDLQSVPQRRQILHGHDGGVWALEFRGDTLVSGGCDRDLRVWNLASGECSKILPGHTSTIRCLKIMDDGRVITGSRDNTLRLWDIDSGQCDAVFRGHSNSIRCLATHGHMVVSGSYDFTVRVWDTVRERCVHTFRDHHAQVYSVAFDGRYVCSGSLDADVRVWDAITGQSIWLLEGHDALVGHMQLRGNTLISGGSDGRVCLWNVETGEMIRRFHAHRNSVTTLQFDDERILSGGDDGVKLWTRSGDLIRRVVDGVTGVWRLQASASKVVAAVQRDEQTCIELMDFDDDNNNNSNGDAYAAHMTPTIDE